MSEQSSTINSVSYASAVEELQHPIFEAEKTTYVSDEEIIKVNEDKHKAIENTKKSMYETNITERSNIEKSEKCKKIVYSIDELINIKTECFTSLKNDPPLRFMAEVFQFWSFKFCAKPSSISSDEYRSGSYSDHDTSFFDNDRCKELRNYSNRTPHRSKSKRENKKHSARDITNEVSTEQNFLFQLKKETKKNNQHHAKYVNHCDTNTIPYNDISIIFPTSPSMKKEEYKTWATNMQNPFMFNLKSPPPKNF